jgi:hypothetical protein
MEPSDDYLATGLAELGIEADEIDLAVARASHELFWPAIIELLALDLGDLEHEPCPDLSKAP